MLFNNNATFSMFSSGKALLFATLMVLIPLNQASATAEYHSLPGMACQPANLNQAINLKATWNHIRVSNPNPLGGASFFVTCPVQFDQGTSYSGSGEGTGPNDIYVYVLREPGASEVVCSARRYNRIGDDNNLLKTVSGTTAGNFGSSVRILLSDVVNSTDASINGLSEYVTVLCALPPQTGVNSLHYDYD